ncbi:MAG: response regulator [Chloroflexi bacterium]|nr:response regulator [Chloroflexota bacterium]
MLALAVAGRVTVIDDSAIVMELLADLLREREPYSVTQLGGRETTVEDVSDSDPQLVILDLRLGAGSTGWDLLKEIRTRHHLAGVPVIVCTADMQSLREHHAELASISNTHVLPKPFDLETFDTLVARVMSPPLNGASTN